MELSKAGFDQRLGSHRLFVSLVGMSNVGKSFISVRLAPDHSLNFARACIDDCIEEKLSPFLEGRGFSGIDGVAAWMGQPYDARYPETQQLYLGFEEASMSEVGYGIGRNLVVDTTGSVIYLPQPVLSHLKEKTLVVYLEATDEVRNGLFERYISNPKPVIWGSSFNLQAGESGIEALKRCYPQLLDYRAGKYRELADVAVPGGALRDATGRQFLSELRSRL
ncbi:hypothetical protein HYU18_05075 [Candidatus Woesearchaeota archaeon]|nr:hypothetical protein [Candidatus Woesearchaeota archaeon]